MTTKRINSKAKGKTGELELAHYLTDHGYPARRGQQFQGTPESPDIICESLDKIHFECKRTEKAKLYDWMKQAQKDAGEKQIPVVCHRRNNSEWLAILPLDKLLHILTYTEYVHL